MRAATIACMVLTGLAVTGACSGEHAPAKRRDAGLFLPETIAAISLGDPETFAPEYREAARAAALYLIQHGRTPSMTFARMSNRPTGEVAVDAWPASMFGHEKAEGGGGMTLLFQPRTHQIEKALKWQ